MPIPEPKLRQHALRGDQALSCCRRESGVLQVQIRGLLSDLLAALDTADGSRVLALVPVPGLGARTVLRAITLAEAGAATAVAGVGTILVSAGALYFLAQEKAAFEMLSTVATAVDSFFAQRQDSCQQCVERRVLSQAAKRQRQRTKILRRL